MEELASEHLPDGYTLAWSTQAFLERQSAGSSAGLYIPGMLMVFLILAAQYERLALTLAVILSIPFSMFGALTAVWPRGLQTDLYHTIGLITLTGIAAKTAFLIFESASKRVRDE